VRGAFASVVLAGCASTQTIVPSAPAGRSVSIYMASTPADGQLDAAVETLRARIAANGGDPGPPVQAHATALGYVDDRRWIDLAPGGALELADLPATADLDSLVVEPLGEPAGPQALAVVQCTRAPALAAALSGGAAGHALVGRTVDVHLIGGGSARGTVRAADDEGLWLDDGGRAVRVDGARVTGLRVSGGAGLVRCAVRGAPGRHLVRVAYATSDVAWHAIHRVDVAIDAHGDGKATVRTGFQIDAPGWTGDAQVALWRGLPGADDPPERVWSGAAGLGAPVTVWSQAREVPAHLISVFRGAVASAGESATDAYWRQQSTGEVRTWLVLDAPLAAGTALVGVTVAGAPPRMVEAALERTGDTARAPLWIDPELRGLRIKTYQSGDEHGLREHLAWSVSNLSDHARPVWIEEELRPARRHRLVNARPKLDVTGGWIRASLAVPPAGLAHASCDVVYDL
jgi:hypothetical protein